MSDKLEQQVQTVIAGLEPKLSSNNEEERGIARKLIAETEAIASDLNVLGTAQEYECDPRNEEDAFSLCFAHFIETKAAELFAEEWERSHA